MKVVRSLESRERLSDVSKRIEDLVCQDEYWLPDVVPYDPSSESFSPMASYLEETYTPQLAQKISLLVLLLIYRENAVFLVEGAQNKFLVKHPEIRPNAVMDYLPPRE